jgi:hypothetical protein
LSHSTETKVANRLCAMFFAGSARVTRFVLVLLLVLWMAGTGCLLGCEKAVQAHSHGQKSDSLHAVVSGDACASKKTHDCCAKGQVTSSKTAATPDWKNDFVVPSKQTSDVFGCPLAANRTAVIGKSASIDQPALVTPIGREVLSNSIVSKTRRQTADLFPSNRGPTYLRCCVFLI